MIVPHQLQNWDEEIFDNNWNATKLFSMEPQGTGTSRIEGLTGYISRLAAEHCTTTGKLFSEVFTPYLNKYYLNKILKRGGNGFYDSAHMINGSSIAAEEFSTMLNELTGMSNLRELTLLRFSNIIPQRGLLRSVKAWCPECFEVMKKSTFATVYDPLVWSIRAVSICTKHHSLLMEICPGCTKPNLMMDRCSSPGFCSHCNTWLGGSATMKMDEMDYEPQIKAKMIEHLLECKSIFNRDGIVTSLKHLVTHEISSITEVARKLSVPKTTFWTWIRGRNLPPISEVLRICNKYGINIVDFYLGRIRNGHSPVIFPKRIKKMNIKLTTRPLFEVRKLAKGIVMDATNGYMHVQAMADAVGCNKKTLYNHFPPLCKAQAVKHKHYLKKLKKVRIETLKREVTAVYHTASSHGELPTTKRLERYLNRPAVFREHEIKGHYKRLIVGENHERVNIGGRRDH